MVVNKQNIYIHTSILYSYNLGLHVVLALKQINTLVWEDNPLM